MLGGGDEGAREIEKGEELPIPKIILSTTVPESERSVLVTASGSLALPWTMTRFESVLCGERPRFWRRSRSFWGVRAT